MKKRVSALIFGLFMVIIVYGQNTDTLTNNSIIKMVKAKLSDELIIDVIKSSPVQFDLSENSTKNLSEQNVSQTIIDAMKIAGGVQNASSANLFASSQKTTIKEPVEKKPVITEKPLQVPPDPVVQKESINEVADPVNEGLALGYVIPVKDLITFHEKEFESLKSAMTEWDKKISDLKDSEKRLRTQLTMAENDLMGKKNADSKSYSSTILELKKELIGYRENYGKAKEKFREEGESIAKEMEKISSERTQAAGNAYNDVSQNIKSAKADPSANPVSVPVNPKDLKISDNTSIYISPSTEMLVWHMNKIKETSLVIEKWNVKVKEVVAADKELSRQLDPLKSKLEEYQSDTKKYKGEIASLKKQISGVEKERKNLAGRMEDDSKELANYIKQAKAEIQKTLEQRFTDIIENINYSFQEN